jgi:hypothetical protein
LSSLPLENFSSTKHEAALKHRTKEEDDEEEVMNACQKLQIEISI